MERKEEEKTQNCETKKRIKIKRYEKVKKKRTKKSNKIFKQNKLLFPKADLNKSCSAYHQRENKDPSILHISYLNWNRKKKILGSKRKKENNEKNDQKNK